MTISKIEKSLFEGNGMYVVPVRETSQYRKRFKKLESLGILAEVPDIPTTAKDAYFISPKVYEEWKKEGYLPRRVVDELESPVETLLKKYEDGITLRTCFWFEGWVTPMGLPSWRDLRSMENVIRSIEEAYKEGERVVKRQGIKSYELGLILQGRMSAEKGGIAMVDINSKISLVTSCFGDAYLIARGEGVGDEYWIKFGEEGAEIIEIVKRKKEFGYFFENGKRIKREIPKELQMQPSLTEEEALRIADYTLRIACHLNSNVQVEFLITPEREVDMYDLQRGKFLLNPVEREVIEVRDRLWGYSASPGRVYGIARIVRNPEDINKIQKGDIVIVPDVGKLSFEDLQNIIQLYKPKAIITGTGGIMSHPATIARETGIPCLVSVKGLENLKDGVKIFINATGGSGTIEIVKRKKQLK